MYSYQNRSLMQKPNLLELFAAGTYAEVIKTSEDNLSCLTSNEQKIYAAALFKIGNFTAAYDVLVSLESALSDSYDYFSLIGATCRRLGLLDQAKHYLEKAVSIN